MRVHCDQNKSKWYFLTYFFSHNQNNESKRCSLMMWWSSVGSRELLSSLLNTHRCQWKSVWLDSGKNVHRRSNVYTKIYKWTCPQSSELSLVFYCLVTFGKQPCDCVLIQLGGFEIWLIISYSSRDVGDKMWRRSRTWPFPLTEDGKRWWLAVCVGWVGLSEWETWVSLFSAPRPPRH